jgi:hypothetical protein
MYGIGRRSRADKERARAKREGPPERRECKLCGTSFELTYGHRKQNKKFCSRKCLVRDRTDRVRQARRDKTKLRQWQGERHCDNCRKSYQPVRRMQRFCSPHCTRTYHVVRLRAEYAAARIK